MKTKKSNFIQRLVYRRIQWLERDKECWKTELKHWPEDSVGYAWRNLGIKMIDCKITIWEAFL